MSEATAKAPSMDIRIMRAKNGFLVIDNDGPRMEFFGLAFVAETAGRLADLVTAWARQHEELKR